MHLTLRRADNQYNVVNSSSVLDTNHIETQFLHDPCLHSCYYDESDAGSIVDGFHLQLSTWQKNKSSVDQMLLEQRSSITLDSSDQLEQDDNFVKSETIMSAKPFVQQRHFETPTVEDIYRNIFENSNVPQVIATPGGRFGAWNRKFVNIVSFAHHHLYSSLTVFDLVSPSALPLLHEIFLTSLFEEFPTIREETNSETISNESYLALTVPCMEFTPADSKYFITLSLMYDSNPTKRCFHCILSTEPTSKVGEIFYIDQDELLGKL